MSNGSYDVTTCNRDKMALYYTEIAAKTWISLSKGTQLLLYRKDYARSILRAFHVKIIVCQSLNLAVGRLLKKKKKKKKKNEDGENRGLADFRIAC